MPADVRRAREGNIWAVVPAAGVGRRMQSAIPKQYLDLNARPVLAHSLQRLLGCACVSGLMLAVGEQDEWWPALRQQYFAAPEKPLWQTIGGAERAHSVRNALQALARVEGFDERDWVLVHDAVRPCVRPDDIEKLVEQAGARADGGLLAMPVRDTMKRQRQGEAGAPSRVAQTVDREGLWHALTPQLFPWRVLNQALEQALAQDLAVTDEASAMEFAGYAPRLVEGHEDNIKITRPADLKLAALYLQ